MMQRPRGLSCADLLAVMVIIIILLGCSTAVQSTRSSAAVTLDQAMIRYVMAGTLLSSADFEDRFISPDLIARKPVGFGKTKRYIPGKGERVTDYNTTESLVSTLIMNMYLEPGDFISPVDVNPHLKSKNDDGPGYDFDCWDPVTAAERVGFYPHGFWDTNIQCNLSPRGRGRDNTDHNSWANSLLCGHRLERWNANETVDRIAWSTRGTRMGAMAGQSEYDDSPAIAMLGTGNKWKGHMCRHDGSVSVETSFNPVLHYSPTQGRMVDDNAFDAEFDDEYVDPGSGRPQQLGASDNFLTYSNNRGDTGTYSAIFSGNRIWDDTSISRCTWDTDGDW